MAPQGNLFGTPETSIRPAEVSMTAPFRRGPDRGIPTPSRGPCVHPRGHASPSGTPTAPQQASPHLQALLQRDFKPRHLAGPLLRTPRPEAICGMIVASEKKRRSSGEEMRL